MRAQIVEEVRPYRLIRSDDGRHAVVEVRAGHVYCLNCDHPRREAPDSPEGMAAVIGDRWMGPAHADALFHRMVDNEEYYSQTLW